jgi:hypothetical protein
MQAVVDEASAVLKVLAFGEHARRDQDVDFLTWRAESPYRAAGPEPIRAASRQLDLRPNGESVFMDEDVS